MWSKDVHSAYTRSTHGLAASIVADDNCQWMVELDNIDLLVIESSVKLSMSRSESERFSSDCMMTFTVYRGCLVEMEYEYQVKLSRRDRYANDCIAKSTAHPAYRESS
jgi:hypothetical protein